MSSRFTLPDTSPIQPSTVRTPSETSPLREALFIFVTVVLVVVRLIRPSSSFSSTVVVATYRPRMGSL